MMDFVAKGTAINEVYNVFLLQELWDTIKAERHRMLTKSVFLPVHNAHVAQMKVYFCDYEILPHPLYSSSLVPSDFHLFPTTKPFIFVEGKTFSR